MWSCWVGCCVGGVVGGTGTVVVDAAVRRGMRELLPDVPQHNHTLTLLLRNHNAPGMSINHIVM